MEASLIIIRTALVLLYGGVIVIDGLIVRGWLRRAPGYGGIAIAAGANLAAFSLLATAMAAAWTK